LVHWSADEWRTVRDTPTRDSGFGTHYADLETAALGSGSAVVFTMRWTEGDRWEGADFRLAIE
jgi:glucoamylase